MSNVFTMINVLFTFALLVSFLILYISLKSKPEKKEPGKKIMYTGGEVFKVDEVQITPRSYAWPLRKAFAPLYKILQKTHSGRVSDYARWLLLGLILFILILMGVMM